eukprot:comp8366_c0_seq1/m.9082 comp8366_c0_seq1/g.9082  ORF comp8366_c0_seq1/g.9082 comp8366_c0_seq1/m.9082 type:complete len:168 (-) comp8366_c0_seq1:67-570(-)
MRTMQSFLVEPDHETAGTCSCCGARVVLIMGSITGNVLLQMTSWSTARYLVRWVPSALATHRPTIDLVCDEDPNDDLCLHVEIEPPAHVALQWQIDMRDGLARLEFIDAKPLGQDLQLFGFGGKTNDHSREGVFESSFLKTRAMDSTHAVMRQDCRLIALCEYLRIF